MKLKIKNIQISSLLKGVLFILIFSFTASSFAWFNWRPTPPPPPPPPPSSSPVGTYSGGWLVVDGKTCDVTRIPRGVNGNRSHLDLISRCTSPSKQCYRTTDLGGKLGQCINPNYHNLGVFGDARRLICYAMCGSETPCKITGKSGSLTVKGSSFNNLPYNKVTCLAPCSKGWELKPDGRICQCRSSQGRVVVKGFCVQECHPGEFRVGTAVTCRARCPSGQEGVGVTCLSVCTNGKVRVGNSCVCPSSKPELIGGTCLARCTNGKVRSGNSCICPSGQQDVSGQCRASCTGGKVRSGSQCVLSCTGRQIPNADRTACLSCPSTQVAKNGNCECPSGQVYRGKRCQAPETAPALSDVDSKKEQICRAICDGSSSCTIESHATTKSTRTGQGSGVSDLNYRKVICP